ncbi:MAG: cytidylate kinase family protein, partial [Muribaculaceae bacterium]|nr:cytidylate kinase family protein [Muribaculaceae bacterium]
MQSSHDDAPLIITIGRQMGCGGRELGRLLASRLGIGYYDKELLIDVARQAGMPPEYLASKDERTPSFL